MLWCILYVGAFFSVGRFVGNFYCVLLNCIFLRPCLFLFCFSACVRVIRMISPCFGLFFCVVLLCVGVFLCRTCDVSLSGMGTLATLPCQTPHESDQSTAKLTNLAGCCNQQYTVPAATRDSFLGRFWSFGITRAYGRSQTAVGGLVTYPWLLRLRHVYMRRRRCRPERGTAVGLCVGYIRLQ